MKPIVITLFNQRNSTVQEVYVYHSLDEIKAKDKFKELVELYICTDELDLDYAWEEKIACNQYSTKGYIIEVLYSENEYEHAPHKDLVEEEY